MFLGLDSVPPAVAIAVLTLVFVLVFTLIPVVELPVFELERVWDVDLLDSSLSLLILVRLFWYWWLWPGSLTDDDELETAFDVATWLCSLLSLVWALLIALPLSVPFPSSKPLIN